MQFTNHGAETGPKHSYSISHHRDFHGYIYIYNANIYIYMEREKESQIPSLFCHPKSSRTWHAVVNIRYLKKHECNTFAVLQFYKWSILWMLIPFSNQVWRWEKTKHNGLFWIIYIYIYIAWLSNDPYFLVFFKKNGSGDSKYIHDFPTIPLTPPFL